MLEQEPVSKRSGEAMPGSYLPRNGLPLGGEAAVGSADFDCHMFSVDIDSIDYFFQDI